MAVYDLSGSIGKTRDQVILDLIVQRPYIRSKELEIWYSQTWGGDGKNVYRHLKKLTSGSKPRIKSIPRDGGVCYCTIESSFITFQKSPPSNLDRFLMEECERMVSRIITSGLLRQTDGEFDEMHLAIIEKQRNKDKEEGRDPVGPNFGHSMPSQIILEDNFMRRQERTLLLRQCESLQESLSLLQFRRKMTIPRWWGEDWKAGTEFMEDAWKNEPKQAAGLLPWLIYLINAIDAIDNTLHSENSGRKTEPNKKDSLETATKKKPRGMKG